MDQTTTGPTTATTDPARRRGLARVLVACSVLAVVLRPVASAVLFPSGDFGMVGSRFARLISIVNVTSLLLTLVAAGLAVAVIVLGAMSLKQRGPGSSGWHETTGMSCVAAAVLVLCPPFHVVVAEPEALMTLHLVTSAVAVLASVMGLVFVGLPCAAAVSRTITAITPLTTLRVEHCSPPSWPPVPSWSSPWAAPDCSCLWTAPASRGSSHWC